MTKLWRKVLSKWRIRKIRQKYLLTMIFLSIIPLSILGSISYNIAKNTLVENQMQSAQSLLKTSSENADMLFENVINMKRLIAWNPEVQHELKKTLNKDGQESNLDNETMLRLENLINSYFINTQDIDSVCIFDSKYHSVCYGNPNGTGMYDGGGEFNHIRNEHWFQTAVQANGKSVFFSENVLVGNESKDTFSSVKLLREADQLFNQRNLGFLVVNVKKSIFSKVFNEKGNGHFLILDHSQGRVYNIYQFPDNQHNENSLGVNFSEAYETIGDEGYYISRFRNKVTGWTFIHIVNEKDLFRQSDDIGKITAIMALIMAFMSLLLSFILSGKINQPFTQLKKLMIDWSKLKGNVNELNKVDEINLLRQTFNQAISENQQLNEQIMRYQLSKKESELRILQAQIKPHFLYNTLESIYWMAILEGNNRIATVTHALSETFKLSLNNGKDLIPVSKELSHIRNFMTIQNFRYKDKFHYIEDIDEGLQDQYILKLLLQPLVENAVYHGLEPKVGAGTVKLTGKNNGNDIIFIIEDDGVGMKDLNQTTKGFGLKNVKERLTLYYGEASSLHVTSNNGTKVEIRFKDISEEKEIAKASNI